MVREYTNKLLEMVAEGIVDKDDLISRILDWMPEQEVKNFTIYEGYVDDEEEADEVETVENHVKIYGDYGYNSECLLHECNSVREAVSWVKEYTRDGDGGGYSTIEVATFGDDGEYITQYVWSAEDYDDGQPDEAQEWHDYDPDC